MINWWAISVGAFSLAALGLFWWWLTGALKKQGELGRDLDAARANEKVKDAQLEIAANPPSDATVIERLRRAGF